MGIVSGTVLFAVIWAVTFFVVLPFRVQTQGEKGDVTPGTPSSAPETHNLKKKALITTAVASVIWILIAATILNGWITVEDFDWFGRMTSDG